MNNLQETHFLAEKNTAEIMPVLTDSCTYLSENVISSFSQAFETLELNLGEGIFNISGTQDFYLICKGRVRLLSFDPEKQRDVSTQLLTRGNTFGADNLFSQETLSYRALAAEPVIIAKIPLDKLKQWLKNIPELEKQWSQEARQRQYLMFLKTQTQLRSLSSYKLEKLSAHLEEKVIKTGECLALATPPQLGRFWLRRGQIQNQSLSVGSSWGYPETTILTGIAQEDLLVYHLPKEHWEDLAPIFTTALEKTSPTQNPINQNQKATPIGGKLPNNQVSEAKEAPKEDNISKAVSFPRPLKPRHSLWKNYPFIEQQSSSDCGVACLAMISQYWGKRFSLIFLRNLAGVGISGVSLKNLAKAADSIGYHARPVRASFNRIKEQKNPWIAHWQGDHFIVVYQIKKNKILIADPAKGKQFISRQDFLASWTGYALILEPTERIYEAPEQKRSLSRFFYLLLPYRSLGLQIILLSVLIQLFGAVSPLLTQVILDSVVINESLNTLNVFVLGSLLFGIWSIGLSSCRQYLLSYLFNRLDLTMISGFINHALKLPLKFFESRRVGDIITRVQENQKIQRFLVGQVLLSWLNFVTGGVYLVLMLYYNWRLTLLVLGLIPPIVILTLVATPLLRQVSRESFNAVADQNSALVEMMTGVSTVKAAAAENELRWRWEERLTHQLNVRFKSQKLGINLGMINGLINSIGGTFLLWYGASLVIQHQLTIGQFVAFNMMKGYIISPVLALADLWDELQEVLISVERLNDVFETEPEESSKTPMLTLPSIKGDVCLENVVFRYETEEESNALQNISFQVKAGKTIAIVGRSGSGKSTLVKLLQGLYYPTNGSIYIDDHNIKHLSPQSLRAQMGVVPQECFLFSGTIFENITLFRPDFSLEQVIEVAKLAEAHSFIQAMPLSYNTKVGERGTNLSGGQRQRIAIARALLGDPRILILDEATSSLDTESERRFQENLARMSRDRTVFIIAHRLSTVRNADCILVLDRGILLEQGTHQELMNQRGLYYHLAQQQLNL